MNSALFFRDSCCHNCHFCIFELTSVIRTVIHTIVTSSNKNYHLFRPSRGKINVSQHITCMSLYSCNGTARLAWFLPCTSVNAGAQRGWVVWSRQTQSPSQNLDLSDSAVGLSLLFMIEGLWGRLKTIQSFLAIYQWLIDKCILMKT